MGVNDVRSGSSVKTADRIFRIVETLQAMDGGRVSEVAAELDMADSTVHRHLQALQENEYVVQEGDTYHIGFRFLNLGDYARNRKELYRLAEPKVEQVAEETNERAEFIVEEFGRAVFVHRHIGSNAIQADSHLGKRLPMHATSAGKAILAHMPTDRVERVLERTGMEQYTAQTITDEEVLAEELATIREEGVAFNHEEYIGGMNTVSVPVMDRHEQIAGALGVSGPAHRLKGDRLRQEVPDLLLGSANELEINISYR
jgi:DNA-binding IclR family transcriptional regulator